MPAEVAPHTIHASAVAICGAALLIRGPSRAGKSRLACALIARTTRRRPIVLIGDDRIQLHRGTGVLVASPHPRIAGFVERRGLGIVAMPWTGQAELAAIVDLGGGRDEAPRGWEDGCLDLLPHLVITEPEDAAVRAEIVLSWWAVYSAAAAPHPAAKADDAFLRCAKD